MKLRLPHALRTALAAVATAALPLATTVGTGTIALGAFASSQADARDMSTEKTAVTIDGKTTEYNGYIWTMTDFGSTNNIITGGASGVKFARTTCVDGVMTESTQEKYYSNQQDLTFDGQSGYFWTIWCNKNDNGAVFMKYGYTLRLAGADQTVTGNTDQLITGGTQPFTLGGLITEAGAGGSYVLSGNVGTQGAVLVGSNAVNMDIQADTTFSYRGGVSVQKGGTWVVGTGKTLLFNNAGGFSNTSFGTLSISAGQEVTVDGGGTVEVGQSSGNGKYNLMLAAGTAGAESKLNITGGSWVKNLAGGTVTFNTNTQLNIAAGSGYLTNCGATNYGAIDVSGTLTATYTDSTFTNGGTGSGQGAASLTIRSGGSAAFAILTNYGTVTVEGATTKDDGEGGTVAVAAASLTAASITNTGTITNAGTVATSGDLSIGTGSNGEGSLTNTGAMTIGGALRNFVVDAANGSITNKGTLQSASLVSWGHIVNGLADDDNEGISMTVTGDLNTGSSHADATVTNYATMSLGSLTNYATVTNSGSLTVTGNIASVGLITSRDALTVGGTANINAGDASHLNITGGTATIATLNNSARITNAGTMEVTGMATLNNGSTLSNSSTLNLNTVTLNLTGRTADSAAYITSTGTVTRTGTVSVTGFSADMAAAIETAGENSYLLASLGTQASAEAFVSGYTTKPTTLTSFHTPVLAAAADGNVYLNVTNLIDPQTTVTLAGPGLTFSANTQAYRGVLADVTKGEVTTGTATLTFSQDTQLDVAYSGNHVSAFIAERTANVDTPVTVTIGTLGRSGNGGTLTIAGSDGVTVQHTASGDFSVKTAQGSLTLGKNVELTAGVIGVANGKTLTLESNATVSATQLRLADDSNSNGTLILKDNAVLNLGGDTVVNAHTNKATLLIGHWSDRRSTGTLQVEGGTLNAANAIMYMQLDGTGVFNMSGGTVYVKGIDFAEDAAMTGVRGAMTLTGGTLHIGDAGIIGVSKGAANASGNSINWGNGTIVADADWQTVIVSAISGTPGAIHLTATADGEAAKLDTNGHTVTFNHKLDNGGKLMKTGSGTVEFNRDVTGTLILEEGSATLSNATTVTKLAGTGAKDKSFSSTSATITTLEVETGATLGGTGGVKLVHIANDGTLSLTGPVTWQEGSTISGSGSTSIDACTHNTVATTVTKTGTGELALGSGIGLGNILDMQGGTLSGQFSSGTVQVGDAVATAGLVADGKSLTLAGGTLDLGNRIADNTLSAISVGAGDLLFSAGNIKLGVDLTTVAVDSTYTLFTYGSQSQIGYTPGAAFWGDVMLNGISVDDDGHFLIADADNTIVRRGTLSVGATSVILSLEEYGVETLHWSPGSGVWNNSALSWQEEGGTFTNGESVVFGPAGTSAIQPAQVSLEGTLNPAMTEVTGYYNFTGDGKLAGYGRLIIGDGSTATDLVLDTDNSGWQGEVEVKSAAMLTVKHSEALGNAQITLDAGSDFALTADSANPDTIVLDQKVTGEGSVLVTGYAHVDAAATHSYSGGTEVYDNAVVDVSAAGALGFGDVTLNGNARLETKVSGAIGAGTIILNDSSKLVLGAEASITTNVLFNGGMLVYGTGVTGGVSRYMVQGGDSIKVDVNGNEVTWVRTPGTTFEVFDNSAAGNGVLTLSGTGKTAASDGPENLVIHSGTVVFSNGRALKLRSDGTNTNACLMSNLTMTGGTLLLDSPVTTGGDGIWTATGNSRPAYLFLTTINFAPDAGKTILIDSIEQGGRKYGIGMGHATGLIYDGSKGGGTATIAADICSNGTTTGSMYNRVFQIGDSAGTDVELDITGSIGEASNSSTESQSLRLVKTGAGTMKLSNQNYMPELQVTEGTVISAHENALGKTKGGHNHTVTVGVAATQESATLDLQKSNATGVLLAGTAKGIITNSLSGSANTTTLTVGLSTGNNNSSFAGTITGNLNLKVDRNTLTLSGSSDYTGSTTVAGGSTLALTSTGSLSGAGVSIGTASTANATFAGTASTDGLTISKTGLTTSIGGSGTITNAAFAAGAGSYLSLGSSVTLSNSTLTLDGASVVGVGTQTTLAGCTIAAAADGNTIGRMTLSNSALDIGTLDSTSPFSVVGGLTVNGSLDVRLSEVDRAYMLANPDAVYTLLDSCTFGENLALSLNGQTLTDGAAQIKLGNYTYNMKLLAQNGVLKITDLTTLTNKMQWTGGESGTWVNNSTSWEDLTNGQEGATYQDSADSIVVFDGEGSATPYAVQVSGEVTPTQLLVQGKAQLTLGAADASSKIHAGNVLVTGAGSSLTLGMANDYDGGTTVDAGASLTTTATNALGTGDVLVTGTDSTLTIGAASNHANTTVADGGKLYANAAGSLGTGDVRLDGGTLELGNTGALASGKTITFNGGILQYGAGATITDISSSLRQGTDAIKVNVGSNSVSWATTPGTKLVVDGASSGTLTLSATSSSLLNLTLDGGKLVVSTPQALKQSTSNNHTRIDTNITISGGALEFTGNRSNNMCGASSSYWTFMLLNGLTVNMTDADGATVSVNNGNQTTSSANYNGIGFGTAKALTYDGSYNGGTLTIAANITSWYTTDAATREFNITKSEGADGVEVDVTGWIGERGRTDSNVYSGIGDEGKSVTLLKTGDGTLRISGANYTPGLTVQDGTVIANNTQALGMDRTLKNTVIVGSAETTATLDLQKSNATGISKLAGNDKGVITNTLEGEDARTTLKVGNNYQDSTFEGTITGNLNLEVATNKLTLTNANTYQGATTVAQGAELELTGNGSIDNGQVVMTTQRDGSAASMSGAAIIGGSIGLATDSESGVIRDASITFKSDASTGNTPSPTLTTAYDADASGGGSKVLHTVGDIVLADTLMDLQTGNSLDLQNVVISGSSALTNADGESAVISDSKVGLTSNSITGMGNTPQEMAITTTQGQRTVNAVTVDTGILLGYTDISNVTLDLDWSFIDALMDHYNADFDAIVINFGNDVLQRPEGASANVLEGGSITAVTGALSDSRFAPLSVTYGTAGSIVIAAPVNIPEPTTGALSVLALAALAARRRRKESGK